jgi:hypothetical protein
MTVALGGALPTNGLVCYVDAKSYSSGTTWTDLSGNGNNLNLVNSPIKSGNVLQFNGSNQYAYNTLNLSSGTSTIIGKSRYSGSTRARVITAYSNNWLLGHWNGAANNYYSAGWITSVGNGPSDQLFRTYVGTADTSNAIYSLYIDGILEVSNSSGTAGPNGLCIGCWQGSSEFSTCEVEYVMAYNRVLNYGEMLQAIAYAEQGMMYGDATSQSTSGYAADHGLLIGITSFTSSGTYTVPTGANQLYVKLVGGGGGSAGYCEAGGAGGYAEGYVNDVSGGQTISVTVGGGGSGVGYYNGAGAGGSSSFGSYLSASGGNGSNSSYSHTGGHGGVGSGGVFQAYGGGGTGHGNHHGSGPAGRGGLSYFGGAASRRHSSGDHIGTGAPGTGGTPHNTDGAGGSTGGGGYGGIVIVYAYK